MYSNYQIVLPSVRMKTKANYRNTNTLFTGDTRFFLKINCIFYIICCYTKTNNIT